MRDIRKLRQKQVDFIVVFCHVGGQYNIEPNRFTKKTIRWLLNRGCNIIIGNHEHVIHGCINEIENNQFATYAIGNLLGSAGIYHEPFDRYAEYSIGVHIYLDQQTKQIKKVTFSVLKSHISPQNKQEVWPVFDLLTHIPVEQRDQIRKDCLAAAKLFSGVDYKTVEPEFEL